MGDSDFICTLLFKYQFFLEFLYFLNDYFFFKLTFFSTFLLYFNRINLIITVVIGLNVQYIKNLFVLKRLAFLNIRYRSFDSLGFTGWFDNWFLFSFFWLFFLMMKFFIDGLILLLFNLLSLLCDFLLFYELFKLVLFFISDLFLLRFEPILAQTQIKLITIFDHISKRIRFWKFISTTLPRLCVFIFLFFIIEVVGMIFYDSKSHLQNAL